VVDDPLVANWFQEAADDEGVKVMVAVDVYAGLTRHGIAPGESAVELGKTVSASKNLKLIGFMGYSGTASHTHGWEERRRRVYRLRPRAYANDDGNQQAAPESMYDRCRK